MLLKKKGNSLVTVTHLSSVRPTYQTDKQYTVQIDSSGDV